MVHTKVTAKNLKKYSQKVRETQDFRNMVGNVLYIQPLIRA